MHRAGLVLIIFSLGCIMKPQNMSVKTEVNDFESHVVSMLGDKYNYQERGDYSLSFAKKKRFGTLFQDVYFIVFDHESQEIILQDTLNNGKVAWKTDIEIEAFANNKTSNNQYDKEYYVFNVLTRSKSKN